MKSLVKIKNKIKKIFRDFSQRHFYANLSQDNKLLVNSIINDNLTYLGKTKLSSLATTIADLQTNNIPGEIIEAGCALGGSSILISKLKDINRALYIYDVFEMIPAPGPNDTQDVHKRYEEIVSGESKGINNQSYYGYEKNLYSKVQNNLISYQIDVEKMNIHLIKGLVQETLKVQNVIALAHIDVDWYDPVMTCLQRIYPMLSIGGSIVLDDYYSWGGCKKATDRFLQQNMGTFSTDTSAGTMKITKISSEKI